MQARAVPISSNQEPLSAQSWIYSFSEDRRNSGGSTSNKCMQEFLSAQSNRGTLERRKLIVRGFLGGFIPSLEIGKSAEVTLK